MSTRSPEVPSRRDFLAMSGSAAGGAWLMRMAPALAALQACASEARESGAAFVTFTPREGLDFEALAARIIPTDDTPGAREAGVVYFADLALQDLFAEFLPVIRPGLAALSERVATSHPASGGFAELDEASQDAAVAQTEAMDPGFFAFARILVTVGFVSNPEHGGNKGGIGWTHIGFEPRYAYQPPFGYYDRNEHGPAGSTGAGA